MLTTYFIVLFAGSILIAAALEDTKYAIHNSYVSKRCPRVPYRACCYWAKPCAITYYMRYYRRTKEDSCRTNISCSKHCRTHRDECFAACDAATTYRERRYTQTDRCKCSINTIALRLANGECDRACRIGSSSCFATCMKGPICPVDALTTVYYRMEFSGGCSASCLWCGPEPKALKRRPKEQCANLMVGKSVAPKLSEAESDQSIQSKFE